MRYIHLFGLLFLLTFTQITLVKACGGGANFVIDYLTEYDNIVHATVIDVDERGYNAILQVHAYFKGTGAEYITVMRYAPALEYTRAIRGYDTSCLYAGQGREWIVGSTGYFALSHNDNGTHTDNTIGGVPEPHFFVEDEMIEYLTFDVHTDVRPQENSVTIEEFEALLLEYGGRHVTISPQPNMYPLMRFLIITTETGQQYRLNPDYTLTILDEETFPLATSNDGSHTVFRVDEKLRFEYYAYSFDGNAVIFQNGYNAIFSPDSNFVAVQDTEQLVIYMFDNYESGGYGLRMRMQSIANSDVSWITEQNNWLVWSADSTTIAYQDLQGIWHWNLFENSEPQLIVPNVDGIALLDISDSGRYVRFEVADSWMSIDLNSSETYEYALATPDERNLIYIRAEYPEDTPDVNRGGDRQCRVPLAETCPIYLQGNEDFDYFWFKNNQIAILSCWEEGCWIRTHQWQLANGTSSFNSYGRLDVVLPVVSAVDYDITYDQPAIAVDNFTIEFDFYPRYWRDEPSDPPFDYQAIDLTERLDSPIALLEWGQPIFYEVNQ